MASIFLVYAGTDEPAVKALVKAIEAAGHFVHSAEPEGPSMYSRERSDCVIVVWSASSTTSPYIYEDARTALKAGRLLQVVTGDFAPDDIPSVFRALPILPVTDSDRIISAIPKLLPKTWDLDAGSGAGMSSPVMPAFKAYDEADEVVDDAGPARYTRRSAPSESLKEATRIAGMVRKPPAPSAPPAIPRHLSQAALEKEAGQLVHSVPRQMRVGVPELVEVRLGRVYQVTPYGLFSAEAEDLPIVETMTVDLYGSPDTFQIVRRSRHTQLVMDSPVWGAALDHQRFGRWLWHVTPKKTGTHELVVKVSADLSDSRGVPTSEPYRDREFPVSVRINYGKAATLVLKWGTTGAVTAVAGAYTQEVWWPKLKGLLATTGFMN